MSENLGQKSKKETVREIIIGLHKGLSVKSAKDKFEKEVGTVTSVEIAEIEQSLMNEGISPDEIKKFCNVHALLFQSALEKTVSQEESPAHPVYLFKLENREIEKIARSLKEIAQNGGRKELSQLKKEVKDFLVKLTGLDVHYTRKEQVLFPYLERYGFMGPSKVMWGKDNEIRDLLKKCLSEIEGVKGKEELNQYVKNNLTPLIEEVDGMIFKEEKILFPSSMEKLNINDWVEMLKESDEVGYVFIEKPKETAALIRELKTAVIEEPAVKDGQISLPTGELPLKEFMCLLNTLPIEITYIDKDGTLRYFSDNRDRIFVRTRSVIGRKVQNCHPPQSVDRVEKIIQSFKEGKKDFVEFWINFKEKFVHIRFFAVRDREGKYLGTVEVTQDVTEIRKLQGEKRLLDERE